MNSDRDQARAIAERVARRLGGEKTPRVAGNSVSETEPTSTPEPPRARMIDFVASGPPVRSVPSVSRSSSITPTGGESVRSAQPSEFFQFIPVAQPPWLGRRQSMLGGTPQSAQNNAPPAAHSSEERFGVEEATVAELVEFFENEKKCSMDPSGKPCDHCAMCSSRGF